MKQVAIIFKRTRPEAQRLAHELSEWLRQRDIEVFCQENIDKITICCTYTRMEIPRSVDLVVVLGGDGTFLSVARSLEYRSTPIIGVNLGGMGFLTEINIDACYREIEQILSGNFEIEERMRLQVTVRREQREVFFHSVLNDAVINKGALARIVDLKTTIDGRYLTNYRSDGLIVATPTGSTAYSLSAGGPIVYPTGRVIILSPICSFTLTNRPIVLPANMAIQVEVAGPAEDVTLTCDGQVGCALATSDQIMISSAANPLRLIKTPSVDYFEILRTKLKWGQS